MIHSRGSIDSSSTRPRSSTTSSATRSTVRSLIRLFARIDEAGADPDWGPVAVTSAITLAECLVLPIRSNQTSLQHAFTQLLVSGPGIKFVAVDDMIARDA